VYGTAVTDRCYSVQLASDGGYVMAGFSQGQNGGGSNNDIFFLKFSAAGVLLWNKIAGGPFNDFCYAMEKTQDGGFVAVGMTNSFGNGSYDYYAVRLAGVSGVGGVIRDESTNTPVEGAIVQELGNTLQAVSDDQGHYILSVFPGVHDLIVFGQCVERDTIRNFTVVQDSIMALDINIGVPLGDVPQTSVNILAPNHGAAAEDLLIFNRGVGLLDWSLDFATLNPRGNWLSVSATSGSVHAGDSAVVTVQVQMDTSNVGVFDLFGSVNVHMNSCPDSVVHIDVFASIINDADEPSAPLPGELTLTAFPNPFNPTTNLDIAIPRSGPVRLAIYDITGREVAVLAAGNHPAGIQHLHFDGSAYATGLYFARVESYGATSTTKLMLLK
jgi:hypothetical protein